MDLCVARQPIFNKTKRVVGYELLFRGNCQAWTSGVRDGTQATNNVLANSLLGLGWDTLVGNKLGFVNFDRELLVKDGWSVMPKDQGVIEVLESVPGDDAAKAACARAKKAGYRVAVDDCVNEVQAMRLGVIADIVKVDIQGTSWRDQKRMSEQLGLPGVTLLAEKVETMEDFSRVESAGYEWFQGFFFAKPAIVQGKKPPALKVNQIRLIEEVSQEFVDYGRVAQLIQQEAGMAHRFLRYVNSAKLGRRQEIGSVMNGLVMLGSAEVRNWASLSLLTTMAVNQPHELILKAAVRAYLCQQAGEACGMGEDGGDLYFIGLFSLMDAMLNTPLNECLKGLPLSDRVMSVLLGRDTKSAYSTIFRMASSYEEARWDDFAQLSREYVDLATEMQKLYLQSVDKAQKTLDGA